MRKVSLILVCAMLLSTGNVLANDVNPKSLSEQISEMLSKYSFSEDEINMDAQVRFTLNNESQIVVLSVDTPNNSLEQFVKAKLNYKNVDFKEFQEGKVYTIHVRVVE